MANKKISALTELTAPASNDVLAVVDTSTSATKKITHSNLIYGYMVVAGIANLGTGAKDSELKVTADEYGNMYTWDDDNSKWRIHTGNKYTTAGLPAAASYTIPTGTLVFDVTLSVWKVWDGSSFLTLHPGIGFMASLTNDATNQTGDGTNWDITGTFTELFDLGGDFSSGTFTAPLTDYYLFGACVSLKGVGAGHTSGFLYGISSDNTVAMDTKDPAAIDVAGVAVLQGTCFLDMAASDTFVVRAKVTGSTKTVGANGGGASPATYVWGSMVDHTRL